MSDRSKVLQAALVADMEGAETPQAGKGEGETAPGRVEDESGAVAGDEDDEKPVTKKAFKTRINQLIEQRDEARENAQQLRQEMQGISARLESFQVALQQGPMRPLPEEDEEDDVVIVRKQVEALRRDLEQERVARVQEARLQAEVVHIRQEIREALKEHSEVDFKEVVREMQLDSSLSPRMAVKAVEEREREQERKFLERAKKVKTPSGDAARRPPTTGLPAGEAPPGPALDAHERKTRMAAAMANRGGVFHK